MKKMGTWKIRLAAFCLAGTCLAAGAVALAAGEQSDPLVTLSYLEQTALPGVVSQVETKAARTLVLEPGAYPPAVVLANFKEKDVDTLLDLMKQAQVTIPLKAVVTLSNRNWVFGDLLAHLQEEHAAFTAAKENHTI